MSNKVYDILKYITLIVLPAIITFYGILGSTLNIPMTQEVLTIATGFNAMLGTCLGISTASYNKKITLEELSEGKGDENE